MRTERGEPDSDGPMPDPAPSPEPRATTFAHLELELMTGSKPIAGSITGIEGRREFTGWIELTQAISIAHRPPEREK